MMKRRDRSSLLSRTCLLLATLFALFGRLPSSHGLSCYCSDEPSNGFPLCHWDNYACSGDVCYVRRFLQDSVYYTKWGCLSNSTHHVNLICNGAFNRDSDHYTCCMDRNSCNENIEIVLPIERATTSSAPQLATTVDRTSSGNDNGTEPSDPLSVSSSTPAVTETEEDATTHSPAPTTVLQPSLVGNIASSLPAATSLPPVSRPTSTPSPNPTGLPQLLKCYCSTCPSLEVTCGPGSSCFVHKDYNLGKGEAADVPVSLSWGCLNRSESAKKCRGQSQEYECCSHKDYCNMELPNDGNAVCNSASGGCQRRSQLRDDDLIVTISVGVMAFIIVVVVLVAIAVLLIRIRSLHKRKSIKAKISGSNSSTNSVTTESESLPSPTSVSSTHHYLHVSSLPENEPAFGDSLKCSSGK